jgi:subtilisin family serine protease
MKKSIVYVLLIGIALNGCKKNPLDNASGTSDEIISRSAIDAFIKQELAAHHQFQWQSANVQMVWSALQHTDNILSVGFKPAKVGNIDNQIASINLKEAAWQDAKQQLLTLILNSEQSINPTLDPTQLIQWEDKVLPVVDVVIHNPNTIKLLRASMLVRYAEPMAYEPAEVAQKIHQNNAIASSSGCGYNTAETGLIANVDYTNISPNAKQSWNYAYQGIPNAWTKSTGKGIKVFIIDTGCEFDQENLGSAFNQGSSSGRTIEKIVTLPQATFLGIPTGPVETADDGCGHGTSMAGACAAPRGTDGNACGVAYNCNLVVCRAAADVYLDESREVKGVSDAFTNAANRADVKIISMSMGKITSSSQMQDAINYAYGKGKLIFCAAGTSFSWTSGWFGVIFPAVLTQVNAVTGVRDNDGNNTCTDCHSGSETDFAIVMEKASNERHPLTLAMSGDIPSTVGGSSVSTATAAGIAALVWSKFPSYTRDKVLNKLITTSANYPNKNAYLGWGILNADAATN